MNIKYKRSIIKITRELEYHINKYIKENYDKIINSLKSNKDTDFLFLVTLSFGYILNLPRIKWNNKNLDKVLKISKLLEEKNKGWLSNFFLNTYKNDFNEKCKVWEENGFNNLKYNYIEEHLLEIKNFFKSDINSQKMLIENFFTAFLEGIFDANEIDIKEEAKNFNNITQKQIDFKKVFSLLKNKIEREKAEISGLFVSVLDLAELFFTDVFENEIQNISPVNNKIIQEFIDFEIENYIQIENIDDFSKSVKKTAKGKERRKWSYKYIHLPYMIAIKDFEQFLISKKTMKLNKKHQENKPSKQEKISFQVKPKQKENVKNIITKLTYRYYLINESKTTIEYLIKVLLSNDFTKFNDKIYIDCEITQFEYIIRKLKSFFRNFNPTSIEKSNLFLNKAETPIKASNIYSSKIENPKEKENIDKIFKQNQ